MWTKTTSDKEAGLLIHFAKANKGVTCRFSGDMVSVEPDWLMIRSTYPNHETCCIASVVLRFLAPCRLKHRSIVAKLDKAREEFLKDSETALDSDK